jgi:hypothetical protein
MGRPSKATAEVTEDDSARGKTVVLNFTDEEWSAIMDFRWKERHETRTDAVKALIAKGLDAAEG